MWHPVFAELCQDTPYGLSGIKRYSVFLSAKVKVKFTLEQATKGVEV